MEHPGALLALAWAFEAEGSDALLVLGDDGRFLAYNSAACRLTGYRPAELRRLRPARLISDGDPSPLFDLPPRRDDPSWRSSEVAIRRKDGSVVVAGCRTTGVVVQGSRYVVALLQSSPAPRPALDRLPLALALEHSPVPVILTDLSRTIVFANPAAASLVGWDPAELPGRHMRELVAPGGPLLSLDQLLASGGRWEGEAHGRRRDGTDFRNRAALSVVYDAAGQPVAIIGLAYPLTGAGLVEPADAATSRLARVVETGRVPEPASGCDLGTLLAPGAPRPERSSRYSVLRGRGGRAVRSAPARHTAPSAGPLVSSSDDAGAGAALTTRELDVLRLILTALRNDAIAERLGVSERTVEKHVASIFRKLGVSNRSAAIVLALATGLVAPSEPD